MKNLVLRKTTLIVFFIFSFASTLGMADALQAGIAAMKKLSMLEKNAHGRLGVFAWDEADNKTIEYRASERFPLCSTSKVMGVAAILKASEQNNKLLLQKIHYDTDDLVNGSPVTKKHLKSGMTIAALSKAAITMSDNTAINLLMKQLGGPKAVTRFARRIGDFTFRLDRWEPLLNATTPGESRDTSTPLAMGVTLNKLVLGNVLVPKKRQLLRSWLQASRTGKKRIRAALPKGWVVGEKTGTCAYGTTNDIAIIWTSSGETIILAIYFTQNKVGLPADDDVIVSAARIVLPILDSKRTKRE